MFTIAIVGRPNVGKSTLFNRFARKKMAIVDDTPGVTRDWRETTGYLFDYSFRVLDTAGLEDETDDSIEARMRQQTNAAIEQADLILFVIDSRAGITPLDEHFASLMRRHKTPVLLLCNKSESEKASAAALAESYRLGLGEPIAVSAEHNVGFEDLYEALRPYEEHLIEPKEESGEDDENFDIYDDIEGQEDYEFVDTEAEDEEEKPLKIAIVGRPNVGKSTLLNAIVQDQRVMTGAEAGITRDAIAVNWRYNDRNFTLVDTAGMRRKARVQNNIEKLSVEDTLRAIRLAQVVLLVLDGNAILEKQDLQIAEHVINEGRALVIVVNKWDTIKNRDEALDVLQYKMDTSLAQLKDIPFVTLSALKGQRVEKLLEKVLTTYKTWNQRVSTGTLNRWMRGMETRNPAPLVSGRPNRLKYMAQIKNRPPTFILWVSRAEKLPASYKRFIINGLRADFNMPGVPIRLLVRRSKNPYAN